MTKNIQNITTSFEENIKYYERGYSKNKDTPTVYIGDQIHLKTKQGIWTVKGFDYRNGYFVLGYANRSNDDFISEFKNYHCHHKTKFHSIYIKN